jgi:hypothetical protein
MYWQLLFYPELHVENMALGFYSSYIVIMRIVLGHNNLFKGLGIGTALTMTLQETAAAAEQGEIRTSR